MTYLELILYLQAEMAALEQPVQQAEPTPWRDMVVVSLVREGINKHPARELADHFAAQPAQEPVRMPCTGKDPRCPCQDGDACHYKDCGDTKARPVQQAEPVAWMYTSRLAGNQQYITRFQHDLTTYKADKVWPLYTTPPAPQRPWVGLTASTTLNMMPGSIPAEYDGALMDFARAIEAKLKEQNNG